MQYLLYYGFKVNVIFVLNERIKTSSEKIILLIGKSSLCLTDGWNLLAFQRLCKGNNFRGIKVCDSYYYYYWCKDAISTDLGCIRSPRTPLLSGRPPGPTTISGISANSQSPCLRQPTKQLFRRGCHVTTATHPTAKAEKVRLRWRDQTDLSRTTTILTLHKWV